MRRGGEGTRDWQGHSPDCLVSVHTGEADSPGLLALWPLHPTIGYSGTLWTSALTLGPGLRTHRNTSTM